MTSYAFTVVSLINGNTIYDGSGLVDTEESDYHDNVIPFLKLIVIAGEEIPDKIINELKQDTAKYFTIHRCFRNVSSETTYKLKVSCIDPKIKFKNVSIKFHFQEEFESNGKIVRIEKLLIPLFKVDDDMVDLRIVIK